MDSTVTAAIVTSGAIVAVEVVKGQYQNYKQRRKKGNMANDLKKATSRDVLIKKELEALKERFGFNRVCVIEYHNGVTTLGGISLKRSSMTHEVVDSNTPSIINDFQGIPCSPVSEMLEELEEAPCGFATTDEDSAVEGVAIAHRMWHVKQAWNFRIGERLVDGVLSCVYMDKRKYFEHEEILDIKAVSAKILLIKSK